MRRIIMLFTAAAMMAALVAMSAGPAFADKKDHKDHKKNDRNDFDFVVFDFDNGFDFGPNFADQELDSGSIETDLDVSIEGNNNNQCVGALQFGQTGNIANQQGTSQIDGFDNRFERFDGNHERFDGNHDRFDRFDRFDGGDNEFEGPQTTFAPENATDCAQEVQQASAASSTSWWW